MIFHYDMKTLTKNNFTMIDKQQKKRFIKSNWLTNNYNTLTNQYLAN